MVRAVGGWRFVLPCSGFPVNNCPVKRMANDESWIETLKKMAYFFKKLHVEKNRHRFLVVCFPANLFDTLLLPLRCACRSILHTSKDTILV